MSLTMKLSGWRKGVDMPAHLRAMLGPTRPFSSVYHLFVARAASEAGTDHKLPNEPPCFAQGDIGSCALNACVGMIACLLAVEGLPFNEALCRSLVAAEEGMKSTIPLKSKIGRALWLADRTVGHQDPGATSFYLMWKSTVDYLTSV